MNTPNETMRGFCGHCGKKLDPIQVEVNGRMTTVAYHYCDCAEAVAELVAEAEAEAERVARHERLVLERKYRAAGIPSHRARQGWRRALLHGQVGARQDVHRLLDREEVDRRGLARALRRR